MLRLSRPSSSPARALVGSLGEAGVHTPNQFTVSVGAGVTGKAYNFAEVPPSDPQGYVFEDINNNGIREAGESGIPNTTITLTGTDVQGNAVQVTTLTDATGFYQFTFRDQAATQLLLPGSYSISKAQPSGYFNGKLQNGAPPAATAANDQFSNLNLTQQPFFGGDYNFGELRPSKVSGFVYLDANNNGSRDSGETGISGVTVNLTGTDDTNAAVSAIVVADINGNFSFQGLRPGKYALIEVHPANLVDGVDAPGVGFTTNGVAGNNIISGIVIDENQAGTAFRFSEVALAPSLISKRLFLTTWTGAITGGRRHRSNRRQPPARAAWRHPHRPA